jgi:hypothetical protein
MELTAFLHPDEKIYQDASPIVLLHPYHAIFLHAETKTFGAFFHGPGKRFFGECSFRLRFKQGKQPLNHQPYPKRVDTNG